MAFTFRLYLPNGEDVGQFATAAPDWSAGMEFRSGDRNRYRIESIVYDLDLPDEKFAGIFIVTPLELAEPTEST